MLQIFFQLVRFAGIGFLNTAVDFAVLNFLMFYFDVFKGYAVGGFAVVSFTAAVLHSYFWNKYWAFRREEPASPGPGGQIRFVANAGQFLAATVLGVAVLLLVVFGAKQKYDFPYYFLLILILGVGELWLWRLFKLRKSEGAVLPPSEFLTFVVVSIIGALINAGILTFGTKALPPQFGLNQELWTNLIKAGATAISLIWNFLGYKLVVFKR